MISQGVRIGLGLFFVFIFNVARSQPSPSSPSQPLTLRSLFDAASVSYPSLLAARLEARASLEDVSIRLALVL